MKHASTVGFYHNLLFTFSFAFHSLCRMPDCSNRSSCYSAHPAPAAWLRRIVGSEQSPAAARTELDPAHLDHRTNAGYFRKWNVLFALLQRKMSI